MVLASVATALAAAAPPTRAAPPSARLMDELQACAAVSGRDGRLACFEAAAAALKDAQARGDLVVVDREQAQTVRRQAFGLNLPSISLFERGDAKALDRVSGRLAGADRDGSGRWTFRLEDGAAWTQVDSDMVLARPRPGLPVEVRRSPLGAFFLSVDGHAGVRVRRVQ